MSGPRKSSLGISLKKQEAANARNLARYTKRLEAIGKPKPADPRDTELARLRADLAAAKEDAGRLRQMLIEDESAACTGCTGYEFPKRPQCESCIEAVDARIAALEPKP